MYFDLHETALERINGIDTKAFQVARVLSCYRNIYKIKTETSEQLAKLSGKMSYQIDREEDLPAVGDYVLVTQTNCEDDAIIHEILPRKSKLSRAKAGTAFGEQLIAANVDYCIIVMALNDDFNIRRLERYIVAIWESGAAPIILLNKEDLCLDLAEKVSAAEQVAFGVPIITTNATDRDKMQQFAASLEPNKTYVLVGSSGVGKSTITNYILGREAQTTRETREGDGKGKHTTTTRDLFYTENGVCLIDTPGMREFALFGSEEGVSIGFGEVEQIADQCQFKDCTHSNEPNCAIQKAISEGVLDADRYQSYLKLQREEAYALRKSDIKLQLEEKKKWKQIHKDYHSRIQKKR